MFICTFKLDTTATTSSTLLGELINLIVDAVPSDSSPKCKLFSAAGVKELRSDSVILNLHVSRVVHLNNWGETGNSRARHTCACCLFTWQGFVMLVNCTDVKFNCVDYEQRFCYLNERLKNCTNTENWTRIFWPYKLYQGEEMEVENGGRHEEGWGKIGVGEDARVCKGDENWERGKK